ncbi:uncharacterized protein TNCV_2893911 [Trichonephila clavipes]|nr:uncharacterized protein TNCV_2893911 [Trichonephila clavipes]
MFKLYPLIGRGTLLSIENKVLLYTAVMRPILAYASPVWDHAAKTNINILDTLQNSLIRMIVKATRYMRNDNIRKALKITSFKAHIQKIAINFFGDLPATNNYNMQNLIPYIPNDNSKRPNENKIDGERQRAGSSAQNGWRRGTEADMRRSPKKGRGRKPKRSNQVRQRSSTHHPDEAPKPRLPDPIDHPIAVMPPSRM